MTINIKRAEFQPFFIELRAQLLTAAAICDIIYAIKLIVRRQI